MAEFKTIDEYIALQSTEVRDRMNIIRKIIKDMLPEAQESISYMMPAFKYNGQPVVYFAGYKKHIGFYPVPSGVEAFKKEFEENKFKYSKGSVQFPLDKPLPLELIKRIVEFRIKAVK